MSILDNVYEAARRAPGALGEAVETITKSGDPEDSDVPGPAELSDRLGSIDDRLEPLERELRQMRESAELLRAELSSSREEIVALRATAGALNESMTQLAGHAEHVLARVPGLSPRKAKKLAKELNSNDADA